MYSIVAWPASTRARHFDHVVTYEGTPGQAPRDHDLVRRLLSYELSTDMAEFHYWKLLQDPYDILLHFCDVRT